MKNCLSGWKHTQYILYNIKRSTLCRCFTPKSSRGVKVKENSEEMNVLAEVMLGHGRKGQQVKEMVWKRRMGKLSSGGGCTAPRREGSLMGAALKKNCKIIHPILTAAWSSSFRLSANCNTQQWCNITSWRPHPVFTRRLFFSALNQRNEGGAGYKAAVIWRWMKHSLCCLGNCISLLSSDWLLFGVEIWPQLTAEFYLNK